jgi:hypothetical protein
MFKLVSFFTLCYVNVQRLNLGRYLAHVIAHVDLCFDFHFSSFRYVAYWKLRVQLDLRWCTYCVVSARRMSYFAA